MQKKKEQINFDLESESNSVEVVDILQIAEVSSSVPASFDKFLPWADCFVVVYAVTNSESFDEIPSLIQKLKARNAVALISLWGTKG